MRGFRFNPQPHHSPKNTNLCCTVKAGQECWDSTDQPVCKTPLRSLLLRPFTLQPVRQAGQHMICPGLNGLLPSPDRFRKQWPASVPDVKSLICLRLATEVIQQNALVPSRSTAKLCKGSWRKAVSITYYVRTGTGARWATGIGVGDGVTGMAWCESWSEDILRKKFKTAA